MDESIVLPRRKTTRRKATPQVLHDCYYTHDAVADTCVQTLPSLEPGKRYCLLEPSAGGGAFVRALQRRYGANTPVTAIDLLPTDSAVQQGDWFEWTRSFDDDDVQLWVIGNPPFRNRLAMRFFQHAAECGAVLIAMILPRSWTRDETQRKVDRRYELVHACNVAESAFHHVGRQYHAVRCVWQVWRRLPAGASLRTLPPRRDYSSLAATLLGDARSSANLVVYRVGVYAGRFMWSSDDIAAHIRSHNFIYLRLHDSAFAEWLRASGFTLENHPVVCETSSTPSMPSINVTTLMQQLDERRAIFHTLPSAMTSATVTANSPSRKRTLMASDDDDDEDA